MNKKRILLGMIIAVLMAICGAFLGKVPSVFAVEADEVQAILNEAGTFYGQGFYVVDDNATLKAEMNVGYEFDAWIAIDAEGNETILSTSEEYTFVVDDNMTVTAKWHKIIYTISVDDILLLNGVEMEYYINNTNTLEEWENIKSGQVVVCMDNTSAEYIKDNIYVFAVSDDDPEKYVWQNKTADETVKNKIENSAINYFDYQILNNTNTSGFNYYNDSLQLQVTVKESKYIYDLTEHNITLNGLTLNQHKLGTNPMSVNYFVENNVGNTLSTPIEPATGFEKLTLSWKMRENITTSFAYDVMYKFGVKSGNEVNIDEIINFVSPLNYYSQLDAYTYLVRKTQGLTVTVGKGNAVYGYVASQFNDNAVTDVETQSFNLTKDSTLTIWYIKRVYSITFASYLHNNYDYYDLINTPLYNIDEVKLTAGESVTFNHDSTTKIVTVNETEYKFANNMYGYSFIGFAVNDNMLVDDIYTLDATNPTNVEIQLVFELIQYNLKIELTNNYFTNNDVTYTYEYDTIGLVRGTNITLSAITNKHKIVGWSHIENPSVEDDYFHLATEGVTQDSFVLENFEPTSDTEGEEYIVYLDIDYKYSTVTYSLNQNSMDENIVYDIVNVINNNDNSKTIVFKDSSAKVPEVEIVCADSDISVVTSATDIITTINTVEFGNIVITENQLGEKTLTYGDNGLVSNKMQQNSEGVEVYAFNKYTYYGEITASVIEYIKLTRGADNVVTFDLYGTTYSYNNTPTTGVVNSVTTTISQVNAEASIYLINYSYDMYLYMNEDITQYSYITLSGVDYYYNVINNEFVLDVAQIEADEDKPASVQYSIQKDIGYNITLSNLLPNHLVIYSAKTVDDNSYKFKNITNSAGSNIWVYDYNGYKNCIISAVAESEIKAEFVKLAKAIYLNITNLMAYSYEDISITVKGESVQLDRDNKFTATPDDNDYITITITLDKVNHGYIFDGYQLRGVDGYLTQQVICAFTMTNIYIDAIIDLCFSEIIYNLNINYIDNNGDIIQSSNGGLYLKDDINNVLTSIYVTIEQLYNFQAIANTGYYVGKAYIGDAYVITDLLGSNDIINTTTYWQLNIDNFVNAIVKNADDNQVDMYIYFTMHTYSAKIYFEISNITASICPTISLNGTTYSILNTTEIVGEETVTRYYVEGEGFEYLSNLNIELSNFVQGTRLNSWIKDGIQISTGNTCVLQNISSDVELIARLQYIEYLLEFVLEDTQGNNAPGYGTVDADSETFSLYDEVIYTAYATPGYILNETYYINASSNKVVIVGGSSFRFNPSNFLIEDTNSVTPKFKIHLVFAVKTVTISVENTGLMGTIFGVDSTSWASYEVSRKRGDSDIVLTDPTKYVFQTQDILVMKLEPQSIGIRLSSVKLPNTSITELSTHPYNLTTYEIIDDDGNFVNIGYRVEIAFIPDVIASLAEDVAVQNILTLRAYEFKYTYNLMRYNFGVKLVVDKPDGARILPADTAYDEPYVAIDDRIFYFGSTMGFSYDGSTMEGGDARNFRIAGFVVADEEHSIVEGETTYQISGLEAWEALALNRYKAGKSTVIQVVLKLVPEIILKNYDEEHYKNHGEYVYRKTYDSTEQGLELERDIIIIKGFAVVVKYDGSTIRPSSVKGYEDSGQPLAYYVEIFAQIGEISIRFEDIVMLIISPAKLDVTYSSINPIEKVYDGSAAVNTTELLKYMKLVGLCGTDKVNISRNISASYSSKLANNGKNLYDIYVVNIVLEDSAGGQIYKNYELAKGGSINFTKIGSIVSRPLQITGLQAKNKVYDGTDSVEVDTSKINFIGLVLDDSTQIEIDKLKFYLENVDIGTKRKVLLDEEKLQQGLIGADSGNYSIQYAPITIDIYPYELTYNLEGHGTFKVVDVDRRCLIPIEAQMQAKAYANGTTEYKELYSRIEREMSQEEKLKICYEVVLKVGIVEQTLPQGIYVYLPKTNKLTQVVQAVDDKSIYDLEFTPQDNFTVLKIEKGDAIFAVITNTTYLPLWLIILIVIGVLLVIGILIFIFILVRRKTKNKYKANERI